MTHRAFTERFLPELKDVERGYTNDPDDPGGPTNHGITEAKARAHGWKGDMEDLPYEFAVNIFRIDFWDRLHCDEICSLGFRGQELALEMADSGVNLGTEWPARWLQEWLNGLNRNEKDYRDIKEDGIVGAMTIYALRQYFEKRGSAGLTVLLNGLNASQAVRYKSLAMEKYLYGWMEKRVKIA